MTIAVTGGNGFIGRALVAHLKKHGHIVRVLDRSLPKQPIKGVVYHQLDLTKAIPVETIAGANAIIHLAGTPVIGRWTKNYKKSLRKSRIRSARRIIDAIRALPPSARPKIVVSASAVGFYGSRGDDQLDERAKPGNDFLAKLCHDWETIWEPLDEFNIRRVSIRTGIVIDRRGGIIAKLKPLLSLKLQASLGSGRQWVSWVGLNDLVAIYRFAVETSSVKGSVNAVAPQPLQQAAFAQAIADVYKCRAVIPVPSFMVRIGLGQAADVVLFSQRVKPGVLTSKGFQYEAETIRSALG